MEYKLPEAVLVQIRQYLYNCVPSGKGGDLLELWTALNKLELVSKDEQKEASEQG